MPPMGPITITAFYMALPLAARASFNTFSIAWSLRSVAAIRGVSLTVESGEFIMLLGKSGSGKTSLLNLIGTIDRPTRGDICVCQTFIRPSTSDQDLARLRLLRLGFVFQTFNLIPSMSALDNVALPMLLNGFMNRSAAYRRAAKLLADVGMSERSDHLPSQLSGGEQQRVTVALLSIQVS